MIRMIHEKECWMIVYLLIIDNNRGIIRRDSKGEIIIIFIDREKREIRFRETDMFMRGDFSIKKKEMIIKFNQHDKYNKMNSLDKRMIVQNDDKVKRKS